MAKSDKERKESLVRFLNQLSIFILLIALFFGALYAFKGNLTIAIPVAIVLVVFMFIISNSLISAKMETKKSGFSIGAKMAWIFYLILAVPVTLISIHGFNVEFLERGQIQVDGLKKIESLKKVNDNYNLTYGQFLNSQRIAISSAYSEYKSGRISLTNAAEKCCNVEGTVISSITSASAMEDIDLFINAVRKKFENKSEELNSNLIGYLGERNNEIINWDRFHISTTLEELDSNIVNSHREFSTILDKQACGMKLEMDIDASTQPTLIASPYQLLMKHLNPIVLSVIVALHFFLLLPYLIAPRKTYGVGSKSKKKDVNNSSGGVTMR